MELQHWISHAEWYQFLEILDQYYSHSCLSTRINLLEVRWSMKLAEWQVGEEKEYGNDLHRRILARSPISRDDSHRYSHHSSIVWKWMILTGHLWHLGKCFCLAAKSSTMNNRTIQVLLISQYVIHYWECWFVPDSAADSIQDSIAFIWRKQTRDKLKRRQHIDNMSLIFSFSLFSLSSALINLLYTREEKT